jgi:hypothetical protein
MSARPRLCQHGSGQTGRCGARLPLALVGFTIVVLITSSSLAADPAYPVAIEIQNVSAKVGEKAVIVATITIGDGFSVTDSYRHRLGELRASDGAELDTRVVRGSVQDRSIVFTVPVTPTRVGAHPVSGVFRFSYHNGQELDIRAARFEATVTGTE